MSKITINWNEAPKNATHALTTGGDWIGHQHWKGRIEFVEFKNGDYYDVDDHSKYSLSNDQWVILEARPKAWKPNIGETVLYLKASNLKYEAVVKALDDKWAWLFTSNAGYMSFPIKDLKPIDHERDQAIDAAINVVASFDNLFASSERLKVNLGNLYDAGLFK